MKFSILIPTYNGSDFVEQAILSALSQTRPADEIVISDDNSADNTLDICRKFEGLVRIVKNDKGPSGFVNGWNFGISQTQGDYISILHQDDILLPTFLEKVENAISMYPHVKHLFVSCEYIDEDGKVIQPSSVISGNIKLYNGLQYVKAYQQVGNPHIHRCPGVVTHRSIFDVCQYRECAGHIADDDFFYRVGQYTDVVGILTPLSQYRLHKKSETGHLSDITLIQRLIVDYSFQLKEMESNTIFDDECKEYFRFWLAKLIEMELVHMVCTAEKKLVIDYRKHREMIDKYALLNSFKFKIYDKILQLIGLKMTHQLISPFYRLKNRDSKV